MDIPVLPWSHLMMSARHPVDRKDKAMIETQSRPEVTYTNGNPSHSETSCWLPPAWVARWKPGLWVKSSCQVNNSGTWRLFQCKYVPTVYLKSTLYQVFGILLAKLAILFPGTVLIMASANQESLDCSTFLYYKYFKCTCSYQIISSSFSAPIVWFLILLLSSNMIFFSRS
jgi:hypothetical protein